MGKVLEFVDHNRERRFFLNNPPGSKLRIARLEDTFYKDKPDEVRGCSMFYLPEEVEMQVIGVIEGTSCPSDELLLMTCENGRLYAFDGEELHMVASSLLQLEYGHIEYPSTESYYNGQAFENMTEEDWAEVKQGAVGKKLDQEHEKLVESKKEKFLENLKSQKSKCSSEYGSIFRGEQSRSRAKKKKKC
uniref:Uncharacterized protein n=1 Tax=Cyprinodon variegatus TaxID=28743 RepID=A0A3Q2FGU3_CYPVA